MPNLTSLPLELAQEITANLPIRDNYRYRMTCRLAKSHCYAGQVESRIWGKVIETWWLDKMVDLGFTPTLIGMGLAGLEDGLLDEKLQGVLGLGDDDALPSHEKPLVALVLVGAGRYQVAREEFMSAVLSSHYHEWDNRVVEVQFPGFTLYTGSLFRWPCDVNPELLLAPHTDKTLVVYYERKPSDIYYIPVNYQENTTTYDDVDITVQLLEVRHQQRHLCRLWGSYTRPRTGLAPLAQLSKVVQ